VTALEAPPAPAPASAPAARFAPGEVLAGRYRVVGPVGRGGMGEVYRADDLKLGQAVALKFLPAQLEHDEAFLARFHAEVRTARQVAHPNVCRVYDIVEAEGRHFLTMEYVDGEDLASLLRRIGQLPEGKALDVARQLCAGLGAIHERGVLHRDLKPANVMLDGHGRVRITDFGLALEAGEGGDGEVAGTPAYMAPEQFEGKAPTVQSDLYALGLVMYEAYTGKRAFAASTFREWRLAHTSTAPRAPSELDDDVDAPVERAILRCLEKDPARRPRSARLLAAALPGGDPLAAALAAGETPSPEMVAAAGGEGALSGRTAATWLGAALLLVAACVAVARHGADLGLSRGGKSPEVLRDRVRELLARRGLDAGPADRADWLERDYLPMRHLADTDRAGRWRRRMAAWGPPYLLVHRQSPRLLASREILGAVTLEEPPNDVSGMVSVVVDSSGRLRRLEAVPPQLESRAGPATDADWAGLFADAGLDLAAFTAVAPEWVPPQPFDARGEWRGALPWAAEIEIRVAAAAFRGRPVYFEVLGPWSVPTRMVQATPGSRMRAASNAAMALLAVALVASTLVLARKNLRSGRGDRRGAATLAAAALALELYRWVFSAHHVPSVAREFFLFIDGLAYSLAVAAVLYLVYMALEPYLRRTMPELLIGWARVAERRYRDPRVGRDLLVGGCAGAFSALVLYLANALPSWLAIRGQTPLSPNPAFLGSVKGALLSLGAPLAEALVRALFVAGVLLVLRLALRRTWVAAAATAVLFTAAGGWGENPVLDAVGVAGVVVPMAAVAARVGIVGSIAFWHVFLVLTWAPLPLEPERWTFAPALLLLAFLAAILVFAYRVAQGGARSAASR